ncbi:hypothetical protein Tco_0248380 [Tanacetum coccineum]
MSSPKFAETHNVVAFLEKPVESDGFAEIIDFLKASSVHYALTVNPIIYTSCIEQFWATENVNMLGDMSHHKKIYVNPSHTKNFFANMKRAEKDFSGRITPLFDTMMVQASEEVGEDSDHPTDSNQIFYPTFIDQLSTSSHPSRIQKVPRGNRRKEAEVALMRKRMWGMLYPTFNDPLSSGEDSIQLNDLMVLCTNLQKQVLDLEKAKSDQAIEIANLKKRVDKLEKRSTRLKRLKKDEDLMFDTGVLDGDEMFVDATTGEKDEHSTKIDDSTAGEAVTTAGVDDSVSKPTVFVTQPSIKDKGKGIMQEPERPLTKKDQVALDEDLARNIQAQLDCENH